MENLNLEYFNGFEKEFDSYIIKIYNNELFIYKKFSKLKNKREIIGVTYSIDENGIIILSFLNDEIVSKRYCSIDVEEKEIIENLMIYYKYNKRKKIIDEIL